MKSKLFIIIFMLIVAGFVKTAAQSSSTEENPKWYYIQVKGSGRTANLALTDVDGQVLGYPLNTSHVDSISRQLWRFEIMSNPQGYKIINKYSKKQLTVYYDEAAQLRRPVMTDNTSTVWMTVSSSTSGYKYLKLQNEPQEGTAGDIYLSQTFSGGNLCKLVSEANRVSANEVFHFQLNDIPVVSSDDATLWLNIRNVKANKYLTDMVATSSGINFTLEAQNNSQSQQWKIINKGNGSGTVEFVNRATGNIISTSTHLDKYFYVDYALNTDESDGWKYTAVSASSNQYQIFTVSDKDVYSYWNATTDGQAPDIYSSNVENSTYAWIFYWVEEVRGMGIDFISDSENIRVYSQNRRIYVDNCNDYKIVSIYGTPVRKNIELPLGVYLVTVKGKTTKILVK
ncbi:MAG: RICIN domain-containing protein [Dysgonamonadaceae bacterium]|jgi:hypothetical protein|nr:RICIN domain-containing protein [Dysgonamonadaceae bacterium]